MPPQNGLLRAGRRLLGPELRAVLHPLDSRRSCKYTRMRLSTSDVAGLLAERTLVITGCPSCAPQRDDCRAIRCPPLRPVGQFHVDGNIPQELLRRVGAAGHGQLARVGRQRQRDPGERQGRESHPVSSQAIRLSLVISLAFRGESTSRRLF